MIERYNKHNIKKDVEKLGKCVLKLFIHTLNKDDKKTQYNIGWKNEDTYSINVFKEYASFGGIFYINFKFIQNDYDSGYMYLDSDLIRISVNNGNSSSDMHKYEDFIVYFRNIISPSPLDSQYYIYSSTISVLDLKGIISDLSITKYDFSQDTKKYNL